MTVKVIIVRLLSTFKVQLRDGYNLKIKLIGSVIASPDDDVPCTLTLL